MMRKRLIFSLIITIVGFFSLNAQESSLGSASSMATYVDTPISLATGIPQVNIPLYELGTSNGGFNVNIGLSYHPYNGKATVLTDSNGKGWSLNKSGAITREINGDIDEYYDDPNKSNYIKNQFSNTYYYNIPGNSGKFRFVRDIDNNTFSLNNISGNNVKIEYTREANNATLILKSFKITDDKGFKYFFDDYSISLQGTSFNYRSAFYLSKILDENDKEIVTYTYDKNIKYLGTSTTIQYQHCKLNTITTSKGKINFEYSDTSYSLSENPYELANVVLRNINNDLISKYFCSVNGLRKKDKNLTEIENYAFLYSSGSETSYGYYTNGLYGNFVCLANNTFKNPRTYTAGLLEQIRFPGKGYVKYNYEANEIYKDKTTADYPNATSITDPEVQYYDVTEIPYDTNISKTQTIQADAYVILQSEFGDDYNEIFHGVETLLSFTIRTKPNNILVSPSSSCMDSYILGPGQYTVTFKGGGNGIFKLYSVKSIPKPYKNSSPVDIGARIKNIKYYDANNVLTKTVSYEYNSFTNSLSSSGQIVNAEDCSGDTPSTFVLYKNVKEILGDSTSNNGYVQYYFKAPDEYTSSTPYYTPFFNLTSSGVLYKKEIYNNQNQLQISEDYNYTFEEKANSQAYVLCGGNSTKPSWLKYSKTESKQYVDSQNFITDTIEKTFSADNYQESYTKATSADGTIAESTIKYPSDLGNTKLLNANMLTTPLSSETKVNGIVASKTESQFTNANDNYPSQVITYNPADNSIRSNVKFDLYDDKGNLLQATSNYDTSSGQGVSSVTIFGYNKTLPIAKITGAKYNQISTALIDSIVNASNADIDSTTENTLITAEDNFRNDASLKDFQVTTYTYDPMIGVTSETSPTGLRAYYKYDTVGRLVKVVDANGNIIKENKYNYKPEN